LICVDPGIHAREWISPATATFFVRELLTKQKANADVLAAFKWVILPVLNPDGYEYSHTKVSSLHPVH
jgi:murein tripeptide amidase MpaA